MTNELTEAEKLAILAELDADDGKSHAEYEARNRRIKEICLAAKGRHYQKMKQKRRNS